MLTNIKEAFRRVSWWGFLSFLLIFVAAIAFIFFAESFKLAVVLIGFGIWTMLAAIYDSP